MKYINKISALLFALFLLTSTACTKNITFTRITPEDALKLLESNNAAALIDVRTPEEFKAERIPGSILVPDYDIRDRIGAAVPDKKTPIIVYCRSGRRSSEAAKTLAELGYTKVYDLGGIINWPYDTEGD